MEIQNKSRVGVVLITGIISAAILFSGCSSDGAEGGGSTTDPRNVDFDAVYNTLNTASGNISNSSIGSYAISYNYFFTIFSAYVEEWDGSSSYTYGSVSVEVTEYNGVWIWTYTDSSTGESIEYRVESTSSGWSFTWTINGEEYVAGTISTDGLTGSVNYFDPDSGEKVFSYTFGSYSGSYALEIVATSYSSSSKVTEVVIRTSSDGSTGTWTYTDYNGTNDGSGSW